MISAPFSLVASFIGNVRFLCPSYFEMYVGVIREFLNVHGYPLIPDASRSMECFPGVLSFT